MELTVKRLSVGARALLQLLSEQPVWHSQKEIAQALGRSVRSVQLYLRELREAGLIVATRRSYELAEATSEKATPVKTQAKQVQVQSARQPGLTAQCQSAHTEAASAVAEAHPVERQLARHLPVQTIRAYGLCRDPELATAALRLYEERLRGPPSIRPRSVGFLIEAIRRPSEFGLVREGSVWVQHEDLRRRAEEMARQEMARARQAQRQAAEAEQRAAEAEYARKKALWDSLPPKDQEGICAQIRRQYPLLGQGWLFQWACLEAAWERRKPP